VVIHLQSAGWKNRDFADARCSPSDLASSVNHRSYQC
jgi:hypothetical protein